MKKHAVGGEVAYFRSGKPGPEARIEAAVARFLPQLLGRSKFPRVTFGSLPLGAGHPDLLTVTWRPQVVRLATATPIEVAVLAYLRAVSRARPLTIAKRLGRPVNEIEAAVKRLRAWRAVRAHGESVGLSTTWRALLPEVIAVEAKVSDWRRAVSQAARNRVFAHCSFIAVPSGVADRIAAEVILDQLGIGVLAVDADDSVSIKRHAVTQSPRVWSYYYQLAQHVARRAEESS